MYSVVLVLLLVIFTIGVIVILIFLVKRKNRGMYHGAFVYLIDVILYLYNNIVKALPLKRNEAYATVSAVSMQNNEAYSAVVPLQRNVAYESVVRPTNTLDTQTSPEYEIIHEE